jgi:hypothetical protein
MPLLVQLYLPLLSPKDICILPSKYAGSVSCDVRANLYAAHMANPSRHVELDIDIGADARDWSAIQANEKLKPVEADLRRIEETVNEIVTEMEYLRIREQKLRDTNESTNERVKWFAFGTMGMLVGLGAWQVVYLRAYFRFVAFLLVYSLLRFEAGLTWLVVQVEASHLDKHFPQVDFPRRHEDRLVGSISCRARS